MKSRTPQSSTSPQTASHKLSSLLDTELFQEKPGYTSVVKHHVLLKEDVPVRQKCYRIPRLLPVLQQELETMESLGVIEPSSSEWCSPIVLVPKKDGTIRFCMDFQQVNALSKFDWFPMPRIDDLVEQLGKVRFISTLDLSKGYWQVLLAEETKELESPLDYTSLQ